MKAKRIMGLCILFITNSAFCQSSFLDSLQGRSKIVAHIKVTQIEGGHDWDVGATEYEIKADVIDLYQGTLIEKNRISFSVVSNQTNFDRLYVGQEYIVFLKKPDWIISTTEKSNTFLEPTDFWLGIQAYNKNLDDKLKHKY